MYVWFHCQNHTHRCIYSSKSASIFSGSAQSQVFNHTNETEWPRHLAKLIILESHDTPPVPLSPWNDTKDALSYPERCIQRLGDGTIEGVEDCLYLNVFTPELPSNISVPRPVLVMIHGGCFMTGYAEERPLDFYIDHGIVVVTIQYRLGALGFMSTGDSLLPGNLGMKDQVLALQWVKQNILAFGGNPDEVTIEGQSSGGAAVQYHMMSPKSKGLFKRAIAQSGSALCPWSFSKNATDRTYRYTSYLGHDAQNSSDLMEFLMTVDAAALVEARYPALNQEIFLNFFANDNKFQYYSVKCAN
ncbi:esterase FE4-like [Schistocerca piceifrons]|uniref:esterase FE4-like n=1 Tax=Schistocerca piceifrons TaxID=274613 RepID=UPI001F5F0A70|nr:esterase FE4-like [Schistocerca piceifrons]